MNLLFLVNFDYRNRAGFWVFAIILFGILTLALQNCTNIIWQKIKTKISLILNLLGVFIFTICLQPYAAIFIFMFLIIKVLILLKKR